MKNSIGNMNYKLWRRGLVFAGITGGILTMMNAAVFEGAGFRTIAIALCANCGVSMYNYLQKHPIVDISDTVSIKKMDVIQENPKTPPTI